MEILRTHPELEALGFRNLNQVYWQLHTPQLYEQAVRRQEAFIAHLGPMVVRTGDHTGRSPEDRFIVENPEHDSKIWWGDINQPFTETQFQNLFWKIQAYFQGKNMFVQNSYVGTRDIFNVPIRVITETAWHNLFVRNMFRRPKTEEDAADHQPELTVIHAPNFRAVPESDGTKSSAFILINFQQNLILIGGTSYAGELKKAIFSAMNYILPRNNIISIHCSATEDDQGKTSLFFGQSGAGKTTLSLASRRTLVGDDEHGWSKAGIFNLEGGSYAKVMGLSITDQPEIYGTTRRFGTILENVYMNMDNRRLDLNNDSVTENTRASYPLRYISNANRSGQGGHPSNIFFLSVDAFGVMPPIAKLTYEQAIYYFLSGYTGKTENSDLNDQEVPVAMFRACFSEQFLPLHPTVYATAFGERIREQGTTVWLANTGWVGGPVGSGQKIELEHTKALIDAVHRGALDNVEMRTDDIFKFAWPVSCPDVPSELLDVASAWNDEQAYIDAATDLASKINKNFKRFAGYAEPAIKAAGPILQ